MDFHLVYSRILTDFTRNLQISKVFFLPLIPNRLSQISKVFFLPLIPKPQISKVFFLPLIPNRLSQHLGIWDLVVWWLLGRFWHLGICFLYFLWRNTDVGDGFWVMTGRVGWSETGLRGEIDGFGWEYVGQRCQGPSHGQVLCPRQQQQQQG